MMSPCFPTRPRSHSLDMDGSKSSRKTASLSFAESPSVPRRPTIATREALGSPEDKSNRAKNSSGAERAAFFPTASSRALHKRIHDSTGTASSFALIACLAPAKPRVGPSADAPDKSLGFNNILTRSLTASGQPFFCLLSSPSPVQQILRRTQLECSRASGTLASLWVPPSSSHTNARCPPNTSDGASVIWPTLVISEYTTPTAKFRRSGNVSMASANTLCRWDIRFDKR
mmetsp:Transcript_2882/g.8083  ORF Transcript_2882/g.8083 Transcript_2882/m.8083 type:complete len:230 (-) Transcript_2882:4920-5609(-)